MIRKQAIPVLYISVFVRSGEADKVGQEEASKKARADEEAAKQKAAEAQAKAAASTASASAVAAGATAAGNSTRWVNKKVHSFFLST